MSRVLRVDYEGARYHVMGRGVARKRVFLNDIDREDFLEGVGSLVRRVSHLISSSGFSARNVASMARRDAAGDAGASLRQRNEASGVTGPLKTLTKL